MRPLIYIGGLRRDFLIVTLFLFWAVASQSQPKLMLDDRYEKFFSNVKLIPNNKLLLDWSSQRIFIWDVESARLIHSLDMPQKDFYTSELWYKTLDISKDGRWVLTWGKTATTDRNKVFVNLWDISTLRQHWIKIEDCFEYPSFSPDGNLIVAASCDTSAGIWETSTGNMIHRLRGQTGFITATAFSPDGNYVVTGEGATKANIKIWKTATGELVHSLKGHSGSIRILDFSPDGKSILSASDDGTAKIWNVVNEKLLHSLEGHESVVEAASFSPDGKLIITFSGLFKGTSRLWDANNGKLLRSITGFAQLSPDGERILIPLNNNMLRLETITGELLYEFQGSSRSTKFSSDGKLIVSCDRSWNIQILETSSGEVLFTKKAFRFDKRSAAFSADKNAIYTIEDNTIRTWDIKTGNLIHWYNRDIGYNLKFHPSKNLALTYQDDSIRIWNIDSGNLLYSLSGNYGGFSPDGRWILTVSGEWREIEKKRSTRYKSYDAGVRIYESTTGQLHFKLKSKDLVRGASISEDDRFLFFLSNGMVNIWDIFTGHLNNSTNLWVKFAIIKFSPNGRWLVIIEYDHIATLRRLDKGTLIRKITLDKCFADYIDKINFSSDGRYFSIGLDCTNAGIWESATGRLLHSLNSGNFHNIPEPAIFSQDGKWVITTGDSTKIWDMETGKLVLAAKGRFDGFNDNLQLILVYDDFWHSLYELNTKDKIISWACVNSNDWVVKHPSGLFDASPGAMKKLYFVQDGEIIELDSLKDKYYEPGLWEEVMSGEPLRILDE